ncbi:hypothetical protein [Streptomyces levis]|uniref:hypothetical protein n=1 Tax=Streptomyces levis TaxID=285566 RepID=UPI003C7C07B7
MKQLLAWWRASVLLRFGKQMVGGLLRRCRAAGAVLRARVDPRVDVVLAAVDVSAVASTVRGKRTRRHVLAEARAVGRRGTPADQQEHHTNRPDHGRGAGRDR